MVLIPLSIAADERSNLRAASSGAEVFNSSEPCYWTRTPERSGPLGEIYPGFGPLVGGPAVPGRWATQPVVQKPFDLYGVSDAYYFPAFGVVISKEGLAFGKAMEEAGYLSPDLSALPFIGPSGFQPPDDVPVIEKGVVTLPWGGLYNYGHFVLDCLPGVAVTATLAREYGFPYLFPPLNTWQARHLRLMGVDPRVLSAPLYRVRRLVFTSSMGHFLHCPNVELLEVADIMKRAVKPTGRGRRLYLSRRGNRKRRFRSEARLEAELKRRGFKVVDPGAMPVDDQIRLFAGAEIVVGNTGAAFTNALYCPSRATIIEVQPTGMHNLWVRNLCALRGLRWAVYFCGSEPTNPKHPEHGMEFDYDVDDFLGFVEQAAPIGPTAGLLSRLLTRLRS